MKLDVLFPSKYIKAGDLQGRRVTVTIDRLTVEAMGQQQERKPVLWFRKATKGLVLNRTNAVIIGALYGDETDRWAGKAITLYPAQVRAFGETHDVVRVAEQIPAQTPAAKPSVPVEEPSEIDDAEDHLDEELWETDGK